MNGNFATDPFATNKHGFAAVGAEVKREAQSDQPSLPRSSDVHDPLATNPLPDAGAPVPSLRETNNHQPLPRS